MSTASDFERNRRARRRRARLRKKRIRAAIILIAFIAVIIIVCVAVSNCKNNGNQSLGGDAAEATLSPEELIPTAIPTSTLAIPSAAEENNLLQIIADAGQTKHCYLTFDDGPTEEITPQILDVLRRYNVKATFFEVGTLIESNPDVARRVYEEGHLIANHSYGHNYEKLYASTESFITDILECENAIKSVTNGEVPFNLIRFLGGSYEEGEYASIKQDCIQTLKDNNYYYINWNCANGDAQGKTKDAEDLLEFLKESSAGYNNLIVLMHDASSKQSTVDALGSIIEYLSGEGYTFHRLDDIDYQGSKSSVQTGSTSSGESETSSAAGSENETSSDNTSVSSSGNSSSSDSDSSSDDENDNESSDEEDGDLTETSEPEPEEATPRPTAVPASTGAIVIQ
ncbi:MAG: polysaccharide deacetylase [Oscillospiraceae bacterium]|nr:polysaccharide deacetylase [Oscillospiraceae bacterium]